ncbi:unnamed protein product [Owenia fusiformis]|uniref:Uncharacterized protein n=1 Tax=Owenia fusiformis TaxID=6347 RepID=A0A8S4PHX2_OWEFU|nr:unnamed protein product [Owenia fusiformis]
MLQNILRTHRLLPMRQVTTPVKRRLTRRTAGEKEESIVFSQNNINVPKINTAMGIKSGDRILTIAASGTHALSKLFADPESILAVDTSAPQLHMAKLQVTGMKLLAREEFCSLIGINRKQIPKTERIKIYEHIRSDLESDTLDFWNKHIDDIADGVLYCGEYSKAFDNELNDILHTVHGESTIKEFLALGDNMEEQRRFQKEIWNTPELHEAFEGRFKKSTILSVNLYENINTTLGKLYLNQLNNMINHIPNNENPSMEEILTGDVTEARMSAYLREGNYEFIKDRLQRIQWIEADVTDYLKEYKSASHFRKLNGVNLSTVPTYYGQIPNKVCNMMKNAVAVCKPGSKLVYYAAFNELSIQFPEELIKEGIITYDGQDCSCGVPIARYASVVQ